MDNNQEPNQEGGILPKEEPRSEHDIKYGDTMEAQKFWIDRKQSFVMLKLWEENRIQQTEIIATVVTGMLQNLLDRLEYSVTENETFFLYFENYIKIWNDHADTIEKNAQKHFTPLRIDHEKAQSTFSQFIGSIENLDLVYAQNQKAYAKMVQQVVNLKVTQVTNNLRSQMMNVQKEYQRLVTSYKNNSQITAILFDQYRMHFEEREWSEQGFYSHTENDSFILEQRYLLNTKQLISDLTQMRELLLKTWSQAQGLEEQRLTGIFDLYQQIVKSNQQIYGIQALQQMVELRSKHSTNDLYTFRGIARKKELEGFVSLCQQLNAKLDYNNVTIDDVTKVMRSVKLQAAPASNLVTRVGVLKRDPGMFSHWTESTVVVTKDKFMHVYPFKDMLAPQKLLCKNENPQAQSEKQVTMDAAISSSHADKKLTGGKVDLDWSKPYTSINLSNVKSIEKKKDNKFEIIQSKPQKSRVSSNRSSVSSNLSKEGKASLNEMTSSTAVKFMEKLTLKGTDDNTFHEWYQFLTKPSNEEGNKNQDFQIV